MKLVFPGQIFRKIIKYKNCKYKFYLVIEVPDHVYVLGGLIHVTRICRQKI